MNVVNAKNPTTHVGGSSLDLEVLFEGFGEYIPFTASPLDKHRYGRELHERARKGEFGEITYTVKPEEEAPKPSQLELLLERLAELESKLKTLEG